MLYTKLKCVMSRGFVSMLVVILPMMAYAQGQSLGEISQRLLSPTTGLHHAIKLMCYVVGVGLLVGGLLQYKRHRVNPSEVRLSTPILLVFLGLFLLLIPTISQYSLSAEAFMG